MENHLDVKAFGSQRIASRIGTGTFNNVYGVNGSYVTAGQQDYAERMNQIQSQKEAYYKELGIAPGVPTEKGAYGDPENTGVGYNTIITNLGDHSVPEGWAQTPKHNTTEGSTPGTPISWNEPSTPDDPQAGYGYISNDTTMEETFFFHIDHLGSTSYITDDKGNITQYDAYLPYGELLVDEHSSFEDLPYKFNGKEFDEETGLYYYGARYMDPVASMWYGVDPLAEKYRNSRVYVYCIDNPIKLIDSDGNGWYQSENKTYQYNPLVNSQQDAEKLIGKNAKYLFNSGYLIATDNSYRYDMEANGDVINHATGEIAVGTTHTHYGSTIINNNEYLEQYEPTFMEKWAKSDNLLAAYTYSTLNDIYIGLQAASGGLLQREEWRNPFTGACFGNLDGTPNYHQIEAIPGLVSDLFPGTSAVKGLTPFKKLNTAQFSHLFKGTFSRLKPIYRGFLNRKLNKVTGKLNEYIGSGSILRDGIDYGPTIYDANNKEQ